MKKVIATIEYFDSGEVVQYIDKAEFLEDLKEAIYCYGISAYRFDTFHDEELTSEVYKIYEDEFGCDEND